jgi:hypothetical protein
MKFRRYMAFVQRNIADLTILGVGLAVAALSVLGAFGDNQQYLWAAVTSILAISAYSSLRQRETLENLSKVEEFAKYGLGKISGSFMPQVIEQHFNEANHEVLILQTWLQDTVTLVPDSLSSALKRGVKARILILDPDSPVLTQRLKDIGLSKDSRVAHSGLENLWVAVKAQKLDALDLEVRMYCALPPFSLMVVDEWMLMGLCWHGQTNVRGPHLEILGKDTVLGRNAVNTFDRIWQTAKPVKVGVVPSGTRVDLCP